MAEIFRQGTGQTKVFRALGPTQRADGTPLGKDEISHYIRLVVWTDLNGNSHPAETMDVDLIEDANTTEYDGTFDEIVSIDSIAPGFYDYWYRTVDTDGRVSADSMGVRIEVVAPLAKPLPPTNITVG